MCGEEGEWWTPKTIGKIINKIDNLELKMQKMSTSEDRGCEPPYKPQVAPPRHGGGSQSRGTIRNPKLALSYSGSWGNNGQWRNTNVSPQNGFQGSGSHGRYNSDWNRPSYGWGRGRFDKSPNVSRPRVASRTVSRDATRCYYCKEPGHMLIFCERWQDDEDRLKRRKTNMIANIESVWNRWGIWKLQWLVWWKSQVFKQLEEFRVSTSCTPIEATIIKHIPQHEKLCLSVSEAHRVYEAVQQDKPVVPMKINLGSDELIPKMVQKASQNPYATALHRNFDSEFQEEPVSALNEADLSMVNPHNTCAVHESSWIFLLQTHEW